MNTLEQVCIIRKPRECARIDIVYDHKQKTLIYPVPDYNEKDSIEEDTILEDIIDQGNVGEDSDEEEYDFPSCETRILSSKRLKYKAIKWMCKGNLAQEDGDRTYCFQKSEYYEEEYQKKLLKIDRIKAIQLI